MRRETSRNRLNTAQAHRLSYYYAISGRFKFGRLPRVTMILLPFGNPYISLSLSLSLYMIMVKNYYDGKKFKVECLDASIQHIYIGYFLY